MCEKNVGEETNIQFLFCQVKRLVPQFVKG